MRKCFAIALSSRPWRLKPAAPTRHQRRCRCQPRIGRLTSSPRHPRSSFPPPIVAAPDGTVYLGSDPMDMPGPATAPIDRVLAIKEGKATVFADKLWSVMGLEWIDGSLYVVHAPFLSVFRDTDGNGKADERVDLVSGLGPKLPGFNGLNDHIAAGVRLGMDGFLYVAIGDKGIPHGVGQGWQDNPAFRRGTDPRQARWDRPGSRVDRRVQPALGRPLRDGRDLHLRE